MTAKRWSIVCFFIHREHRSEGVGSALLEAAVAHAADHGAEAVEGYPLEPRRDRVPESFAWQGLAAMFEQAGFTVIARRKEGRPIFRRTLR